MGTMSEGHMRLDAAPEYAKMAERIVHCTAISELRNVIYEDIVERCIDSPACMWLAVTF